MVVEVNALQIKKNPLYSSSVAENGLLNFKGRSVSFFKYAKTSINL